MSWRGRPPATGEDEGDGRVSARVCAARCGSGGRRRKPAATVDEEHAGASQKAEKWCAWLGSWSKHIGSAE